MEALDGRVLFRVADATGDVLTTIAQLTSVFRAFALVARSELWPRYCLSRATLAKESELAAVAAVVERLVREAGSADAPQNAASSLARCMSACSGVAHACAIALRVNAALQIGSWLRLETESWCKVEGDSDAVEESGVLRAASGSAGKEGGAEAGESGSASSTSSVCCKGAEGLPTAGGAAVALSATTPTPHAAAPAAASPLSIGPHREEGGEREGGVGEGVQERAAVLMPTKGCWWEHSVAGEPCCVLRGAVAKFKHSRYGSAVYGWLAGVGT
ncbi:unnamed protein product [Closterium sp. NIES-65]|nr:unnamed protein product [Closterium sp. NIES-65]